MLGTFLAPKTSAQKASASALSAPTLRLYRAVSGYFSLLLANHRAHVVDVGKESQTLASNVRVTASEDVVKGVAAYAKRSKIHTGQILRGWADKFYDQKEPPLVRKLYCNSTEALINNEDFRRLARQMLQSRPGVLNTATAKEQFLVLVKLASAVDLPISDSTTRRWLRVLGYRHKIIDKGGITLTATTGPTL